MQKGALLAAPLAAATVTPEAAAQVTVDYAHVTTYSNSGWFTNLFVEGAPNAGGASSGSTATLTASRSITDELFWRYDSYYGENRPRSDTTGLGFIWGGALANVPAVDGDKLDAQFNITLAFTHAAASESDPTRISYQIYVGYRSTPFEVDVSYLGQPRNGSDYYTEQNGSFYGPTEATSPLTLSNHVELSLPEGSAPSYWFVQLHVNWNNEYANSWNWNHDYTKLNGDTLGVTGSVAFSAVQAAAVPEPANVALGLGFVAVAGAAFYRRRAVQ